MLFPGQVAIVAGVALLAGATSLMAQKPGETRTAEHRWASPDIIELSRQVGKKAELPAGIEPPELIQSWWENDGTTVWIDSEGTEWGRGLYIDGRPWDGTFLFSFDSPVRGQRVPLVGLQEWSHGSLIKSVIPEWYDVPDDSFNVVPHLKQKLSENPSPYRTLFERWLVSMRELDESNIIERASSQSLRECYRLMEFPSFAAARSLRVEINKDGEARLYVSKVGGRTEPAQQKAAFAKSRTIPQEFIQELREVLGGTSLFSDTKEFQQPGLDGTHFIFEAVRDETYYYRDYWSPDLQAVNNAIMFCHRVAPELNSDPNE